VQPITARSNQIIEQLLSRLPDLLGEDMAQLLSRLAAEGIPTEEDCCKEASVQLAQRAEEFLPAMAAALARSCRAACQSGSGDPTPGAAPAPASPTELRLLDEEVAEEDAMLAAISRRLRSRASLSLLLLGQRFGVLLARPPLSAAELPLGPRAFCDALAHAAEAIGLCVHARLSLYRLFDLEGLAQYAGFADAMDAILDDAGILRGMSFVPLRRKAHVAVSVAQATERDALQAVSRAAESLRPESRLPAQARGERGEAISALARFLMRHGRDSSQWSECIDVAESLQDAAFAQAPVPAEVDAWLRKVFVTLGYAASDAGRLASGLTDAPAAAEGDAAPGPAPARERGVREQRCFDRLEQLPVGAMLGFSAGSGGFLHARLEAHHQDPSRLLLSCSEGGCELIFEVDMLARLLASGEAWVMRRGADTEGGGP
jgi:hypothetical protein